MSEDDVKREIAAGKVVELKPTQQQQRAAAGASQRETPPRRQRRSQRVTSSELLNFVQGQVESDEVELWHTRERDAYATMPFEGGGARHHENWPIDSGEFRRWMTACFYDRHGAIPGREAVGQVTEILIHRAVQRGSCYASHLRIARHNDCIYLDLCDPRWRALQIAPAIDSKPRWSIVDRPPVKFRRGTGMQALPEPSTGSLALLAPVMNFGPVGNLRLAIGWMLATLNPDGPFPVLQVVGEQGSAKSTFCRMILSFIDPQSTPLSNLPKELEDVVIAAEHCHVLAFDNVSKLNSDMSDQFCQIATGNGTRRRAKYTNRDMIGMNAKRPLILNSITDGLGRADLADRSIVLHLPAIPDTERRTERQVWSEFQEIHPKVLGSLCDAVSVGLARVDLDDDGPAPRMADAVRWVRACEPALAADAVLGWRIGDFDEVYEANREEAVSTTIDGDLVADVITRHMASVSSGIWEGTPSAFYEACDVQLTERERKSASWPASASVFSRRLQRATGPLRAAGITVEGPLKIGPKTDRRRLYVVRRTVETPAPAGAPDGP